MSVYWAILILPALLGLSPVKADHNLKTLILLMFGLMLIILIGFRHEVGGDWFRYLEITNKINIGEFNLAQESGGIGYQSVQWVSVNYLNGVYATNLICAIFFVFGLVRFCQNLPIPWLALFVSTPFLIVVVSMGYTRQAAAIGFLMWGLVDLMNGKRIPFVVSVLIASLFHITAVVMLPIALLYRKRKMSFIHFFGISLLILLLVFILFSIFYEQLNHMIYYYITIKLHHSGGAIARVLMNFSAAVVFLFYRKQFRQKYHDEKLWFIFSMINILLLPASFYYSTVVDRFAIYFLPLQLVIFSRVPTLISSKYNRTIFILGTIFIYFSALFVWLFFGRHSNTWLPYQNLLTIY
jgi:hypothetical protein